MPASSPHAFTRWGARSLPAAGLATAQNGVIARDQLVALRWSGTSIDRRIADRTLSVVWPAVYGFGHAVLTRDGWLTAAVLACGRGSVLVAHAAGAARGLLPAWSTIDVATPKKRGVELNGIRAHRLALRPEEVEVHRGLPVTTLARTALDVAASEPADRVGDLLDRALLDGQYCHAEMTALLEARAGCRGVAVLRAEVAKLGDQGVVFRSRGERLARDALRVAGLPAPQVNAWFPTRGGHGYELDLWFRELRLAFEIDGPHHEMPRRRRLDALRDADLASFGVTVVRFPERLVREAPEEFVARARRALLTAGSPPSSGGDPAFSAAWW